jgi:hypothetical protein
VYKWKGRHYPLYNGHDSSLNGMGREIIVQIIEWMVRFNGSTHKVKEFLSSLLEKVEFQTGYRYRSGDGPVYLDIESNLSGDCPIVIEELPVGEIPSLGVIMYIWTIDIDTGYFEMKSFDGGFCVPWRYLYQIRLERDEWNLRDFGGTIGLIKFQACVRRFLASRRALCPPDGVLYLLAKKRFETARG